MVALAARDPDFFVLASGVQTTSNYLAESGRMKSCDWRVRSRECSAGVFQWVIWVHLSVRSFQHFILGGGFQGFCGSSISKSSGHMIQFWLYMSWRRISNDRYGAYDFFQTGVATICSPATCRWSGQNSPSESTIFFGSRRVAAHRTSQLCGYTAGKGCRRCQLGGHSTEGEFLSWLVNLPTWKTSGKKTTMVNKKHLRPAISKGATFGCGRMLMSDDYQVSKMDLLTDDGLKKNTLQTRQEGRGEVF